MKSIITRTHTDFKKLQKELKIKGIANSETNASKIIANTARNIFKKRGLL